MQIWTRSLVGLVVGAGACLAAYLLLSPAVWTRDDLSSLQIGSALAAAGCLRVARVNTDETSRRALPTWLVHTVAVAACLTAANVVIAVGGGFAFGDGTLGSTDQAMAFAVSCAIVVGFVVGTSRRWGFGHRAREMERRTRIAGLREQARRDIDELVAEARDAATNKNAEPGSRPTP